jgi:hypothetical protein
MSHELPAAKVETALGVISEGYAAVRAVVPRRERIERRDMILRR